MKTKNFCAFVEEEITQHDVSSTEANYCAYRQFVSLSKIFDSWAVRSTGACSTASLRRSLPILNSEVAKIEVLLGRVPNGEIWKYSGRNPVMHSSGLGNGRFEGEPLVLAGGSE